jgi:hypothetical protein
MTHFGIFYNQFNQRHVYMCSDMFGALSALNNAIAARAHRLEFRWADFDGAFPTGIFLVSQLQAFPGWIECRIFGFAEPDHFSNRNGIDLQLLAGHARSRAKQCKSIYSGNHRQPLLAIV